MAKPIYLLREFATKYKGKVVYARYTIPKNLSKRIIERLFIELTKRDPRFMGLIYFPDSGKLIVYVAKTKTLFIQVLIPVIAGVIIGVIGYKFLFEGEGEGDWNPIEPPGTGFDFWTILKIGLVAIVVYMFGKAITDIYLAFKEKKPMESPYTVYVQPIAQPIGQAIGYVAPLITRKIK